MDRERLAEALGRMENAFARLEAAASRPRPDAQTRSNLAALAEQNARLRESVAEALAQIDDLVARLEK